MKLRIDQILLPGAKLEVKKVDFDDPEIIKEVEECKARQRECLERKKVDWSRLRNTIINI
jgi:hypothetical protein